MKTFWLTNAAFTNYILLNLFTLKVNYTLILNTNLISLLSFAFAFIGLVLPVVNGSLL